MGLKPKLTYDTSRNPHEDFLADSRYPNIPQDSQGLQEDGGAGRSLMVSTNPKKLKE
jgi:hypothetical protein